MATIKCTVTNTQLSAVIMQALHGPQNYAQPPTFPFYTHVLIREPFQLEEPKCKISDSAKWFICGLWPIGNGHVASSFPGKVGQNPTQQ